MTSQQSTGTDPQERREKAQGHRTPALGSARKLGWKRASSGRCALSLPEPGHCPHLAVCAPPLGPVLASPGYGSQGLFLQSSSGKLLSET